jgi:hypothetical protein
MNFCGESHDKGFSEDADAKASTGVLHPLTAFLHLF